MMLATVSLTNWSRFGSNMILYRYGDDGDDVMYRHMMSQHKDQTEQRHGWMPWDSWGPEAWHRKASMSPFEFRVLVSALDHVNVENDNASSLVIALVRPLCSRIFDSERIMLTIHRLTSRFMHAGRINLLTDIFSQCLRHSPFPELRDALFMYGARLQRGMYDYLVFCSGCGLYEEVCVIITCQINIRLNTVLRMRTRMRITIAMMMKMVVVGMRLQQQRSVPVTCVCSIF